MLQAKQATETGRPETLLERAVKRQMAALREAEVGRVHLLPLRERDAVKDRRAVDPMPRD